MADQSGLWTWLFGVGGFAAGVAFTKVFEYAFARAAPILDPLIDRYVTGLREFLLREFPAAFPPPAPKLEDYTSDIIFGARWTWHWESGRAIGLSCLCPYCDSTNLRRARFPSLKSSALECQRCGREFVIEALWHEAAARAADEVGIRMRNGQWKDAVGEKPPS